jgi:hypothetical protein
MARATLGSKTRHGNSEPGPEHGEASTRARSAAFETRQQTTEQPLQFLLELAEQVKKAWQERDATKLSPESFAVYWLLKHDGVEQADSVARRRSRLSRRTPTGKPAATMSRSYGGLSTRP